MLYGIVVLCKLEDMSHYLNKIELVNFNKSLLQALDWRSDCKCC